jgi:competence protein ComEC
MSPEWNLRPGRLESIWQAPLVPVALAATAGVVLDRVVSVPLLVSFVAVLAGLAGWGLSRSGLGRPGLPLAYLFGATVGLGAAYHHWYREIYPADDIGAFATAEPRPVRVRGVLLAEPARRYAPTADEPLRSYARPESIQAVLQVTAIQAGDGWPTASGRARLVVAADSLPVHVGDEVEVVGQLTAPRGPANPGEFDHADYLRDQRIRAELVVRRGPDGVSRLAEDWPASVTGWLALVRGWGQRVLERELPRHSGVAQALLLGEGGDMSRDDWDRYLRTGVIHVLAISGQHLVVLAFFLWLVLRLAGVRRRQGAWLVALCLFAYALLTGGRPPVLRSAVTVATVCGGLILRRPALPANSFALAWLIVLAVNPTDLFTTGCQLSFLSVAVLYWGTSRWLHLQPDAVRDLADAAQPFWLLALRRLGRLVLVSYLVTLAVWLALSPLVAARYHLVSPIGVVLGPPMILLSSLALIAGFLLLAAAAVCQPLVPLLAALTDAALAACDALVRWGDQAPAAYWYVGTVPGWWLAVFYTLLVGVLVLEPLRQRWRWAGPAGLAWLCVGLLAGSAFRGRPADELRCTFLAVGHGGCTVLELPDGRTFFYDAGAITGPDVTRRQIAPFLWQRGIVRIDELILSHADLDHFNGVPALLERFTVGQVTCTPSFADRTTPGTRLTLATIERHGISRRIIRAGDVLSAGDVLLEVLHPPERGPEGVENTRSLVLRLRHAGHTILLTGDLEGAGLERLLTLPAEPVDVLMAPHHGSRFANTAELARWAQPKLVVACQGPPTRPARADPYTARGIPYLGTWPHGAITIRSHATGLVVETWQSGQRFVLPK